MLSTLFSSISMVLRLIRPVLITTRRLVTAISVALRRTMPSRITIAPHTSNATPPPSVRCKVLASIPLLAERVIKQECSGQAEQQDIPRKGARASRSNAAASGKSPSRREPGSILRSSSAATPVPFGRAIKSSATRSSLNEANTTAAEFSRQLRAHVLTSRAAENWPAIRFCRL